MSGSGGGAIETNRCFLPLLLLWRSFEFQSGTDLPGLAARHIHRRSYGVLGLVVVRSRFRI
jgi:hypothetical protein